MVDPSCFFLYASKAAAAADCAAGIFSAGIGMGVGMGMGVGVGVGEMVTE